MKGYRVVRKLRQVLNVRNLSLIFILYLCNIRLFSDIKSSVVTQSKTPIFPRALPNLRITPDILNKNFELDKTVK